MKHYILIYTYVEGYLEKRSPYRSKHFEVAQAAVASGYLLLGGATENPADQGVLIFKVESRSVIKDFIAKDPYVTNGIVTSWEIKEWNVVVGIGI